MRIAIANSAEVDAIWPSISEKMQTGCDKTGGGTSSAEMWQMCRRGDAFLIVGFAESIEFASVWRFETWPSGQVFRCVGLCGAKPERWMRSLYDFALSQAKIGGTDRLIAQGRKGWRRLIERHVTGRVRTLWETVEVH
ncbi:hypothetical protein HJB79_31375 [Rhizobium lentis]|uniref:hypothetical protein n=1 Tax=Rhizobium lentis TaxID=1138194 RepID=UPI001C82D9DE|nr:hypothetical protein [Rhizobium lentis]MBX5143211.1 hypothetical protein [Rhizobium lentis]